MVGSSVGDRSTALYLVPRQLHILCRHKTELAVRAIPRVIIGCNSTWLHDTVIINTEPHVFNKLDHGVCPPLTELIMSLTLDRKVATGLLSKATTGNDLLTVLEMVTTTFVKPPVTTVPTLEEIKF